MVTDHKKNRLATRVAKPENGPPAARVVTPPLAHDISLSSRHGCGTGAALSLLPGGGCAVSGAALDAAAAVTSVAVLGKNRASPPSTPKNREFVRVAVASKLMAGHWKKTGENLKGSSVLGCGRWRNYGADPNIAEIDQNPGAQRQEGNAGGWCGGNRSALAVAVAARAQQQHGAQGNPSAHGVHHHAAGEVVELCSGQRLDRSILLSTANTSTPRSSAV